jgi:hypothetical protein
MSRHLKLHGDGTAWLVADRLEGDYLCYWYVGTGDDHLVESERVASASAAVTWGRVRTPRVRIRTAAGCTYWAGTANRPEGFTQTWTDRDATVAAPPSWMGDTAPPDAPRPDQRQGDTTPSRTAASALKAREMAASGTQ